MSNDEDLLKSLKRRAESGDIFAKMALYPLKSSIPKKKEYANMILKETLL